MNLPVSYADLQPYLLSKGEERACYINPKNSNTVLKLSSANYARQSLREIDYFTQLQKRNVPPTHIPRYVRIPSPGFAKIDWS